LNTSDAYKLIVNIENSINIDIYKFNQFNTWPIVRQILWIELISVKNKNIKEKNVFFKKISYDIFRRFFSFFNLVNPEKNNNSTKIFISRPVYLQKLPSGKYFDRIVDPIIEDSINNNELVDKYYLSLPKHPFNLSFKFRLLIKSKKNAKLIISNEVRKGLDRISKLTNIEYKILNKRYIKNLSLFVQWYEGSKKIFLNKSNLKEIYFPGWYFPDLMGVCAAASELKIRTVDVQHGKQGKFHAMYSGWNKIPKKGFDLMPDNFWCWGDVSCKHILKSSPNRKIHIPFVGGHTWISYYRNNLNPINRKPKDGIIHVLVTMQPPQGSNIERIPEFLINFLLSKNKNIFFTFRLHPNDSGGYEYCKRRLSYINDNFFSIDDGKSNLYDLFNIATHHITSYSSCCYEAEFFNVPSLIYGLEGKKIYADEINDGVFAYTDGSVNDLNKWLRKKRSDIKKVVNYIDI